MHPLFGYHDMSGMTSNMSDVLMQTARKHNPPEGEYWAVKDGEVYFKDSDPNKVQQEAASKGGIMVFPGGSFYVFSIHNPQNK
jgi:hypothetical protein